MPYSLSIVEGRDFAGQERQRLAPFGLTAQQERRAGLSCELDRLWMKRARLDGEIAEILEALRTLGGAQ